MAEDVIDQAEPDKCPNDCARFGGNVPGYTYGSNWPWVPCQDPWHAAHPVTPPTDDEQLIEGLRAECVEFHADDGVTDDCVYVRAADRLAGLVEELRTTRRQRDELEAAVHAAWHLMDDSGELSDEDMEGFHGDYVHLKLDHQRVSDALDALEEAGWDPHPES